MLHQSSRLDKLLVAQYMHKQDLLQTSDLSNQMKYEYFSFNMQYENKYGMFYCFSLEDGTYPMISSKLMYSQAMEQEVFIQ